MFKLLTIHPDELLPIFIRGNRRSWYTRELSKHSASFWASDSCWATWEMLVVTVTGGHPGQAEPPGRWTERPRRGGWECQKGQPWCRWPKKQQVSLQTRASLCSFCQLWGTVQIRKARRRPAERQNPQGSEEFRNKCQGRGRTGPAFMSAWHGQEHPGSDGNPK